MELKGIDVSKWNGTIDWEAVAGSGVQFAMIRAATGLKNGQITRDPRFAENVERAAAAGLRVGAYLYSYAKSETAAMREADGLLGVLAPYREKITFPVAYDIEEASQAALGRNLCTAMAQTFCEVIRNAGYQPVLYANPNWLKNYIDCPDGVGLWLARWNASKPGQPCDMWQYSDSGNVPGISGNVDMNLSYSEFFGTKGECDMADTKWAAAIRYLVESDRMDSPDIWREVCSGARTASAAQVQALLSKWAEDRMHYDGLADGIRELLDDLQEKE